jgi:ppGpp synthetase/RelA/SpoT-type nucleotidyltranferase
MADLEAARRVWLAERPKFEAFASAVATILTKGIRRKGILVEVSHRAKDMDSLIKKLIKKPNHSYESLPDKAGVRVIVRHISEIDPVLEIAAELLDREIPENKATLLEPDTFGYLSVHAQVRIRADHELSATYPSSPFQAEMQVRTLAQHLWAEMAHNTVYKSESMIAPLDSRIQRRVYMLAGMVELADYEFDRIESEMPTVPEFQLLKSLERSYYKLTVRRSDPELSIEVIHLLLPLYNLKPETVAAHLEEFFAQNEELLHRIYEAAEEVPDHSAFLFQPEALMIFDLLRKERLSVRESWEAKYPVRELERIALAFGMTFE